ncbi:hypothetical protein L4X63_17790 [Geomonas sp. Red32]|uniref:hypothetical protein n=1 Tax=Geomonas sp. Red32 TaxID=2912856 RepID=UPI00202CA9CB|nr:hypothetical protein [Geomonas sp. Red32]MCM0083440.1 hypothetical protein [Geomonas sp. Red32]
MVSQSGANLFASPEIIASTPGAVSSLAIATHNGNTMLVWGEDLPGYLTHTIAKYYDAANGWYPAVQLEDSLWGSSWPSVNHDAQGNFYAVWVESQWSEVVSARFLPSSGWLPAEVVSTGDNVVTPQIAADGNGTVFVAWLQYNFNDPYPGEGKVYSNVRTPTSGWAVAQQLKTAPGGADTPTLAVDSSGRATVMWSQNVGMTDGSPSYGIYFSRFE